MSDRYKVSFKVEVINYYDQHRDNMTKEQVCEEKSIAPATLNSWLEDRSKIFQEQMNANTVLGDIDSMVKDCSSIIDTAKFLAKNLKDLL